MQERNSANETARPRRTPGAHGARHRRRGMTSEEYSVCNGRQWLRADRLVVLACVLTALAVFLFALHLVGSAGSAAKVGAVLAVGLGLLCAHRAEKMYERRQAFRNGSMEP